MQAVFSDCFHFGRPGCEDDKIESLSVDVHAVLNSVLTSTSSKCHPVK